MRFHCGESMTAIDTYVPLAQAIEKMGYAGFVVPDSLIYPQASDQEYLYTKDGGREFLENKPFIESFILATMILTATTKLEVTSNVIKLPVRQPLYSAKLATSVAAMSGNRFNFGVGLSVWPEDYVAMGVDFAKRGKRLDECIEIVRGLSKGGYFEYHGEFYDLPAAKLNPVPTAPLPILIGGHADLALKRAAHNDGFMYAGGGAGQLAPLLEKIAAFRAEAGTTDRPFRIFATEISGEGGITIDTVRRMEDLGVTDMPVIFRNVYAVEEDRQPLQDKIDAHARFADEVIAKV
ncbi:LLM class flavin-dependent oxidoreductase [Sphingomonas jatrophae]|uniref:Luciferase-like monooxygenase n=1 Tax=Sphingomonas jatrophae TaxID=1166337 RepID=A0A1I6KLN2_9SPHN|nr:LLM class flavin-dependent oxidoreductase [Sphingomonas jatrophae]SFR91948.1 Luciferase-like monooxygenase [Sphingomonas jatrophae]